MTMMKQLEETILRVARGRGVIMGPVAAEHMIIDLLQALREPSCEMLESGSHCMPHDTAPEAFGAAKEAWQAMIDAALGPDISILAYAVNDRSDL